MRFTIKLKLVFAFGLIILLTDRHGWRCAITNLSSLNLAIADLVAGPATNLVNSGGLSDAVSAAIRAEKNAVMDTNPAEIAGYTTTIQQQRKEIDDALASSSTSETSNASRLKLAEFQAALSGLDNDAGPDRCRSQPRIRRKATLTLPAISMSGWRDRSPMAVLKTSGWI